MSASHSKALQLTALVLVGGVLVVALWIFAGFDREEPGAGVVELPSAQPSDPPLPLDKGRREPDESRVLTPSADFVEPDLGTTVIWPLEVQLTQVSRASFEQVGDELPVGSGANAALEGHIWGPDDRGLRATVTFTAGSNAGRVLSCDAEGALGASDLYPGLAIVRITTPNGHLAEREVRLRARQTELLNVGFGHPASVFGSVVDLAGDPLAGVAVTLDGHQASTDEEGVFFFPAVASGMALATCSKHGYALYRETVPISAGRMVESHQLEFRLVKGASLELTVDGNAGDLRAPARVYLFPLGRQSAGTVRGQRTFPWHLVSPVEIWPGGTKLVEGLPDGNVMLSIFRPGAVSERSQTKARLYGGQTTKQVLRLLPGPRLVGEVLKSGKKVEGALIRLEASNRQAISERVLGKGPEFNQEMIFPHLPAAVQEVRSDSRGEFGFTLFPELGKVAYLTAESPDGAWRASQSVVLDAEQKVELELEPVSSAQGTLELELSPRFQALPVSIRVMGAPRDPFDLQPQDQVVVEGLEQGTWRVDVEWNRERLIEKALVDLTEKGPARLELSLPQGAILGQNEEERRRAAR